MFWIYTAGVLSGFIVLIVFRNYRKEEIKSIYGEGKRYRCYPCFLRTGTLFHRDIKKDKAMLRDLYPMGNTNELLIRTQVRNGQWLLLSWFGVHLLGLALTIVIKDSGAIYDGRYILRESDDGTLTTIMASAHGESLNIADIPVEVRGKLAEGEEREKLFELGKTYVLKEISGNNASLEHVQYPLNFVTDVPDTSMTVSWDLDMAPLVMPDGSIEVSQVPESGTSQEIKAILNYGGEQRVLEILLKVFPETKTDNEKAYDEILSEIRLQNEGNSDVFKLPEIVQGEKVYWTERKKYTAEKTVAAAAMIVCIVIVYRTGEKKRKISIRSEQMIKSYPKFIHKLVLLTGAGLNIRHALQTMSENQSVLQKGETDYVNEEVKVTLKMMAQGVPEIQAYEMFGRHCGDRYFVKLSVMMIQCVKKGAAGMNELMSGMADEAMMIQRDQIRQKSERAGTKLLMPMGMLLTVVFMILVVPAFLSMNL